MISFVQFEGLVCFFCGSISTSNGSRTSHSESIRLLEYGIVTQRVTMTLLHSSKKMSNGFYMSEEVVGKPIERVDARLKVTGEARYTAEQLPNLAHVNFVQSAIANGRILNIDTSAAEKASGVLAILTHKKHAKAQALPDLTTQYTMSSGNPYRTTLFTRRSTPSNHYADS